MWVSRGAAYVRRKGEGGVALEKGTCALEKGGCCVCVWNACVIEGRGGGCVGDWKKTRAMMRVASMGSVLSLTHCHARALREVHGFGLEVNLEKLAREELVVEG